MQEYLDRFENMVEEIKRCDAEVALLNYARFAPASADLISQVEHALGFALDSSILEFFRLTNGLQLRWISKNSLAYDPKKHTFTPGPFQRLLPWGSYLPDTGLINILPLEEIYLQDWKGFVWFGSEQGKRLFFGVEYTNLGFRRYIKPFDAFSNDYSMVFFVGDQDNNPKVLLAEDHLANFTSSKVTNFKSYLEFLVANKGIVKEREIFYSDEYNSSAKPKAILQTDKQYWSDDKIIRLCDDATGRA